MRKEQEARLRALQARLDEDGIHAALIADPDSVWYFAGYANYLGIEFGRPTLLFVPAGGDPTVITPLMESDMAGRMTWIGDIRPWEDGRNDEWRAPLAELLNGVGTLGIEERILPAAIAQAVRTSDTARVDLEPLVGALRMIKSPAEIDIMRQAGAVAVAMAEAGKQVIAADVPEYEVALAVIAGGTRKAASFLGEDGDDRSVSPTIHNLQILQSGHDTCLVHRRSSTRRIRHGEPVYMCFCGIASFRRYNVGFDREYFVGAVTDAQAQAYATTLAAQAAALAAIRPGVTAESVHQAAEAVYRDAGLDAGYRTGRAVGCSYLEQPELKGGDQTILAPGMTFAVDGGVTLPGDFGARVGDSIVVTEDGYEMLTPYPKELVIL